MENEELKENKAQDCAEQTCEKTEKNEKCEKKKGAKKWQEEVDKALAEAEECKRKWYAVTAEYENYRRRTLNQAAMRYAEGRNDVISALFPIGDNLERALGACADEKTKQGLEMVLPAGEGEESGIVKQVYVKGYKKGEKILRYAQVIVTQ